MEGAENAAVKKRECLGSEGWEKKFNPGPDRGATVQFVCGVMERRWVGQGDKLAWAKAAWTQRIRGKHSGGQIKQERKRRKVKM